MEGKGEGGVFRISPLEKWLESASLVGRSLRVSGRDILGMGRGRTKASRWGGASGQDAWRDLPDEVEPQEKKAGRSGCEPV